jgi:hypothetical protein
MRFPRIPLIILIAICSWMEGAEPANAKDQLKLEIRLFEIEGAKQEAVGFDWYLGNVKAPTNVQSGEIGGVWPQAPQAVGTSIERPVEPNGKAGTLTGILNDPLFRTVIRALEQREGVTPVIFANAPATADVPMKLQRPDGWQIHVLPKLDGDEVELEFEVAQTKGEYAGFLFRSKVKVQSGKAVVFSDFLDSPKAGKKSNAAKRKRLMFLIQPTVESK